MYSLVYCVMCGCVHVCPDKLVFVCIPLYLVCLLKYDVASVLSTYVSTIVRCAKGLLFVSCVLNYLCAFQCNTSVHVCI